MGLRSTETVKRLGAAAKGSYCDGTEINRDGKTSRRRAESVSDALHYCLLVMHARGQRCRNCRQLHHFAVVCPRHPRQVDRCRRRPGSPRRVRESVCGGSPTPLPLQSYETDDHQPLSQGSHPSRGRDRSPSPGYTPPPAGRHRNQCVRFRSPDDAGGVNPGRSRACAIIAATSPDSAPRILPDVTAQNTASVLALPDTGADICVGVLDFLETLGEYPENPMPLEQHPRAANGRIIRSIGVLPVRFTFGEVTTTDNIHILEGVCGLLLSWKTTRRLKIIPRQISEMKSSALPSSLAGCTVLRRTRKPTVCRVVDRRH